MAASTTEAFYAAPGSPVRSFAVPNYGRIANGWRVLREDIAGSIGCDEDELSTAEVVYRDGNASAECVIYAGRIIGAVDWLVAAEDWPAIFEAHLVAEIERIMTMPDAEIDAALRAEGKDPAEVAHEMRELFERVIAEYGLNKLEGGRT